MSVHLPACTSPYHRGSPIVSRSEAFERRIEFRRLTDQGRETVVLDRIVCRACMRTEVADRRAEPTVVETVPLFGS